MSVDRRREEWNIAARFTDRVARGAVPLVPVQRRVSLRLRNIMASAARTVITTLKSLYEQDLSREVAHEDVQLCRGMIGRALPIHPPGPPCVAYPRYEWAARGELATCCFSQEFAVANFGARRRWRSLEGPSVGGGRHDCRRPAQPSARRSLPRRYDSNENREGGQQDQRTRDPPP